MFLTTVTSDTRVRSSRNAALCESYERFARSKFQERCFGRELRAIRTFEATGTLLRATVTSDTYVLSFWNAALDDSYERDAHDELEELCFLTTVTSDTSILSLRNAAFDDSYERYEHFELQERYFEI